MTSRSTIYVKGPKSSRGFTAAELLVAMGAAALMLMVIITLFIFAARSFAAMGNYVDLDDQSRNTVDTIGREIRGASALVAFQTTAPESLTFTNSIEHALVKIVYDPTARTLVMQKTGQPDQTNLTQCDQWSFTLYDRAPQISSTNISFYLATNSAGQLDPSFCKLVNMTWKCSRTILSTKWTTESVQTAQIVLRNKVK